MIKDFLGWEIPLGQPYKRIVSVVPSQTELLLHLVEHDHVVGRTKFCVFPSDVVSKVEKVGGTKNLNIEKIKSLSPDLIIANKEENVKEQIEELKEDYPVYVSQITDLKDHEKLVSDLGELTGTRQKAVQINQRIMEVKNSFVEQKWQMRSALYMIWKDPYMIAGQGTFINYMLSLAGFENLATSDRYPILNIEQIHEINPDLLMLSSEPFPFKEKHLEELQNQLPETRIKLVDGTYFSWYGIRLLEAFNYFNRLQTEISTLS